ncbi:hypothetical protein AMS68_002146 [Peltaster fructicola]|uniref:Uncharacterized protein n=1 Tax=Peltaster fructicola TaxID=286661 RepID=A0A6H0XPT0_9PEZI|nr:hypothetical protein AMS68_002146 [Peltaster fructicola]
MLTSFFVSSLIAALASASPLPADSATSVPLVASLGSSYSAGLGLAESYGNVLADMLAQQAGLKTPYNNYNNYAVSGSNSTAVPDAAKQLGKKKYAAVVMTTGGNDLNYVACLGKEYKAWCGKTISKDEFVDRYTKALEAILANVGDAKNPIYVVTYTEALGSKTKCASTNDKNALCNITPQQEDVAKGIYTNLVDWTVTAFNQFKTAHPEANPKMITMRDYSKDKHDIDSQVPWINGSEDVPKNGGANWHPNTTGAKFIAQVIYNDINGKPAPSS